MPFPKTPIYEAAAQSLASIKEAADMVDGLLPFHTRDSRLAAELASIQSRLGDIAEELRADMESPVPAPSAVPVALSKDEMTKLLRSTWMAGEVSEVEVLARYGDGSALVGYVSAESLSRPAAWPSSSPTAAGHGT